MRNPDCTSCELHKTCSHVCLIGEGKPYLGMIIGEAPGADEDEKGRPFIGRAGTLLTSALHKASAFEKILYITNSSKYYSSSNRAPTPKETLIVSSYRSFAKFAVHHAGSI